MEKLKVYQFKLWVQRTTLKKVWIIIKKRRYRVESKSKDAHFRVDCYENELEYWKDICKHDAKAHNGKCYYRQFPVTKAKKIYY